MNPDFPQIIDKTLQLRDKFYPHAKVSVLSNATLIAREAIFQALCKVDNPIMKIDASSDQLIRKINKPAGSYNLDDIVDGLKRFDGNFILQTMFLRSEDFDTVADGALERWMDIVRELRPREVMVYTIDRETPQSNLQKYSVEQMQEMVRPLVEEGFKVQVRG
jgi:wyosine [tRNA(Phe)-imidazoG37] synthetase (radical SAM superfamily)